MKVLDLFAGIGGFSLGLEKAGMETVAFCEINEYAQKVLKKNWPGVPIYEDVRQITANRLVSDGIGVDVITGGFPCQDISVAGNQVGIEGERSGLWTECARLLGDIRPKYAIFENVPNLLNGGDGNWFKRVLWDISKVGYDAEWKCIRASDVGAPHRRERIWIVCYPNSDRKSGEPLNAEKIFTPFFPNSNSKSNWGREKLATNKTEWPQSAIDFANVRENVSNSNGKRLQRRRQQSQSLSEQKTRQSIRDRSETIRNWWFAEPSICRVADGVPNRSHRLKCLGNAVVPQIPELIGRAIMEHELETVA